MLTNIQHDVILMLLIISQQESGVNNVTDEMLLIGTIKSKGIKYCFLAECLKLSYQSLRNKITNKREFLPSEIEKICEVLEISDDLKLKNDIFFAKFVEEKSTKEELSNVTEVTL